MAKGDHGERDDDIQHNMLAEFFQYVHGACSPGILSAA
jgi:hypothetical protein